MHGIILLPDILAGRANTRPASPFGKSTDLAEPIGTAAQWSQTLCRQHVIQARPWPTDTPARVVDSCVPNRLEILGKRSFDGAGPRKCLARRSLSRVRVNNSSHQSKCHQLMKSVPNETEISPSDEPGNNDQAPPAQIGFSCGGEVDGLQFTLCLRAGGWTIRRELEVKPICRGV
jgi:hypothetical protein